jgi:hypothetical protein
MSGHTCFLRAVATIAAPLAAVAATAAGQIPTREMSYICRVSVVTTDSKGEVTPQPTIVARTVVRGDSARADVIAGMGDFKPGVFFLTHDGGHTLYIVNPEKRQYSVVPLDSMGDAVAGAVNRGAFKVKLDNVQAGFERVPAADSIGGFRTEQVRINRSFRVTLQVLLLKKRIQMRETRDMWLSPDLPRLPNPLGGMYLAIGDATSRADAVLTRKMAAIDDSVGTATRLRVVHRLVTGNEDDPTETVTTIETLDLAAARTDSVHFDLPAGFKRKDK